MKHPARRQRVAASLWSVPCSSIESTTSRSENAFTMKPPEEIASKSPSSCSRTSAIRTGVREAPVASTACNSEIRSPGPQITRQNQIAQTELGTHRL